VAGRVGAIVDQFAVVWITDAPALAAAARFAWLVGENRKLTSSKKPIGIWVAACAVAAGTATNTSAASSAKR
jgi:hypothetical protein